MVERVAHIRSGQGSLDAASDLVALSALLLDHWDAIEGKRAVERKEIELAATRGPRLLVALGTRENEKTASDVALEGGAFTPFVRAYDDDRRAVAYLRWKEGDADAIAPSLVRTHGGGTKPGAEAPPARTSTPTTP